MWLEPGDLEFQAPFWSMLFLSQRFFPTISFET